jgi:hypothetical protein
VCVASASSGLLVPDLPERRGLVRRRAPWYDVPAAGEGAAPAYNVLVA